MKSVKNRLGDKLSQSEIIILTMAKKWKWNFQKKEAFPLFVSTVQKFFVVKFRRWFEWAFDFWCSSYKNYTSLFISSLVVFLFTFWQSSCMPSCWFFWWLISFYSQSCLNLDERKRNALRKRDEWIYLLHCNFGHIVVTSFSNKN